MPLGMPVGRPIASGPRRSAPPVVLPFLFKRELIDLLAAALGIPVAPNTLPAEGGADPMLVVSVVDGDSRPLLAAPGRSYRTDVQIDAWGSDEGDVQVLAWRTLKALHGYRGPLGRGFIQSSIAHRQFDTYEHEGDPARSGSGPYRSMREFRVAWTAPA